MYNELLLFVNRSKNALLFQNYNNNSQIVIASNTMWKVHINIRTYVCMYVYLLKVVCFHDAKE